MKQQSGFRGGWLLFPLLLIVLALVFMPGRKQNELSYQQFKQVLESGDVGFPDHLPERADADR